MLEISDQADPSPETTAMMTMVKKIPFSYRAQNGNFIVIYDLEDFGHMLDLYYDDNNGFNEVKNFHKWHKPNKKYAVLYKETSFLYPTEQGISGLDWTKITEHFVVFQTFTGPGAPALTNEVVQITTGFKEMSDTTKNLHVEAETAKEIVNTTDLVFPTDVARVYNKVQRLQRLCKLYLLIFELVLPNQPVLRVLQ